MESVAYVGSSLLLDVFYECCQYYSSLLTLKFHQSSIFIKINLDKKIRLFKKKNCGINHEHETQHHQQPTVLYHQVILRVIHVTRRLTWCYCQSKNFVLKGLYAPKHAVVFNENSFTKLLELQWFNMYVLMVKLCFLKQSLKCTVHVPWVINL